MSNITLSSAVRQNLLSLQDTATLLSQTQEHLATGLKVNSALENPTNFFTASGLNSRASDIGNLLDSIGNGVQVLQAANTGITSLQSLVSNAQSIANQVLQAQSGFATKSSISTTTLAGATSANLLGNSTFTDNSATSAIAGTSANFTAEATTTTAGTAIVDNAAAAVTANTSLDATAGNHVASATLTALAGQTITVNGNTVTFNASLQGIQHDGNSTVIGLASGTSAKFGDILTALQTAVNNGSGTPGSAGVGNALVTVTGAGAIQIATGAGAGQPQTDAIFASTAGVINTVFGFNANVVHTGGVAGGAAAITAATTLQGAIPAGDTNTLTSGFKAGDTITVNNSTLTFVASGANSPNQINVTDNVQTLLTKIDTLSGNTSFATASSVDATGHIILHTGTGGNLNVASSNTAAFGALGLAAAGVTVNATPAASALSGQTLTIAATKGGTATNIVFGAGAGQVSSLAQLNTALSANNLQASLSPTGTLTISTTNDAASQTIGAVGGSAVAVGQTFASLTTAATAPVADPVGANARSNLVTQFNQVLSQINTTAVDASFNGVNLLNGDSLKLVFDETGKSSLTISGTTFSASGLGLTNLTQGTDFLDNASANSVLSSLGTADATLRSEASALGSNLSVVEIRQDFNKNLINVLQTGASNLTLADSNEEAANSQALSTRQSIATSALALANQSQQNVLQLLR